MSKLKETVNNYKSDVALCPVLKTHFHDLGVRFDEVYSFLEKIIEDSFNNDEIKSFHVILPFEGHENKMNALLALMAILYLKNAEQHEDGVSLEKILGELERKSVESLVLPSNPKEAKRILKKVRTEKKRGSLEIDFYRTLKNEKGQCSFQFKSLFIFKESIAATIKESVNSHVLAKDLSSLTASESYNCFITRPRSSQFFKIKGLLDKTKTISNIIIFDPSYTFGRFKGFSRMSLSSDRLLPSVKRHFVFSFSEHLNFSSIQKLENNAIETFFGENIVKRFVMHKAEVCAKPRIYFGKHFSESDSFSDLRDFVASHEGMQEFKSYKLRNVLSQVISESMAEDVLKDLLSPEGEILNGKTIECINRMDGEVKEKLRNILRSQFVPHELYYWRSHLLNLCKKNNYAAVLINRHLFGSKLMKRHFLEFFHPKKVITWDQLAEYPNIKESILVLDFRDIGSKSYPFAQNFFEIKSDINLKCDLTLQPKFLHTIALESIKQFNQFKSELHNNNTLNDAAGADSYLEIYYDGQVFITKEEADDYNQIIEASSHYEYVPIRFKITYLDDTSISYYSSDFFIVEIPQEESDPRLEVLTCAEIKELFQGGLVVRIVRIVDMPNIFSDFDISHAQHVLLETESGKYPVSYWKDMLLSKTQRGSVEQTYENLMSALGGTKLISIDYFRSAWLNPSSQVVLPRSYKAFELICKFLEIPEEYVVAMKTFQREARVASEEKNRAFIHFLKCLIQDNLIQESGLIFEDEEIVSKYKKMGISEKLSINESDFKHSLFNTIEFVKENIILTTVKTIIKVQA